MQLPDSKDTIVAVSTPPGYGGIGVVRISGDDAFSVASRLVAEDKSFTDCASHTIHHCHIKASRAAEHEAVLSSQPIVDEVVIAVFNGPKSYTGEDVIEISAHGNPRIMQRIVELAVNSGCRRATPGEFTLRAFQSGRIDLVQAESVADLIAAEGTAYQQAAMYQLSGSLSAILGQLRAELIEIAALFEAYTDFPDEEIPQEQHSALEEKLGRISLRLSNLAASYSRGQIIRDGIQIPIVGPPNAGKSSLFNAIIAEERSIVTEIPGTTRDTIAEKIDHNGLVMRIVDTAGLRATTDQIEALGVDRSKREISGATVMIVVFDATRVTSSQIEETLSVVAGKQFVLVFNKADLLEKQKQAALGAEYEKYKPHFLSAQELIGISELIGYIASIVNAAEGDVPLEHTLTNSRHHEAVVKAVESLDQVESALGQKQNFELLAFDLRQAINQLEEILGRVSNEDLLAEIFGRFCIGK